MGEKRTKRQKWGQPQLQENEKEIPERSDPKREGLQFFRYTLPKYLNDPWITHAYGRLQTFQQKNKTTLNWRLSHHKRDSICSLSHQFICLLKQNKNYNRIRNIYSQSFIMFRAWFKISYQINYPQQNKGKYPHNKWKGSKYLLINRNYF